MILDMVGGAYLNKNIRLLALNGRLVQIAFLEGSKAEIDALPIMTKRLTVTGSTLRPRSDEDKGEIARALAERVLPLMEQGQCLPRIHQVFPLAEAAGARADGKQPPHRQDHAAGAAMSAGTHAAPASATSGAARFAGQTAIVTGAVGGIGSAIVEGLLAEGARVGLIDFNGRPAMPGPAARPGPRGLLRPGRCVALRGMRSRLRPHQRRTRPGHDPHQQRRHLAQDRGARAQGLGNAARRVGPRGVGEPEQRVLHDAPATPHMVAQRKGRVINMSSVAGKAYCDIVAAHYAATKAALIGLTRHWAAELGEYDVTVNGLAPGRISTPLLKSVPQEINDAVAGVTALRRLGTPEEVADACLFFASDRPAS